MTIGQKLQELRKKQAMSQEVLAEKLSVTRQTVSKWEVGQSTPDVDMLVMISDIFDVSLDSLMRKNKPLEVKATENPTIGQKHDLRLIFGIPLATGSLLMIFILFVVSIIKPTKYINEMEGIYESGFIGFLYAHSINWLFTALFIGTLAGIFLIAKYLYDKYDWI